MKVEYKLPKGYRWVRAGEKLRANDRKEEYRIWIFCGYINFTCEEPKTYIRKIKRKKP